MRGREGSPWRATDAPRPWEDVDELELATLTRGPLVQCTNGCTAPAATCRPPSSKQRSYAAQQADPAGVVTNSPSLHQAQGDSCRLDVKTTSWPRAARA